MVNLREINLRDPDVVRIDRLSAWGNPKVVGIDGSRPEVIEAYRGWISGRPDLLERLGELDGKRLACWCAPLPCHGDVLLELLAAREPEDLKDLGEWLLQPDEERAQGEPERLEVVRQRLTVMGPCARCRGLTVRYGERGRPLCSSCQPVPA